MNSTDDQKPRARGYSMRIDEIRPGDLLDAVRREHRWEVIRAYLLGRGITPSKHYDERDPIAYYEWEVPVEEIVAFETGLDKIDAAWRKLLRVFE
jgi:hypothetical protein